MTNPQRKTLEEVLPCGMLAACSSDGHDYRCPAHYRPAVEAWAAETEAQFNHLLETERKVWQSRESERYRQALLERASRAERSLEKMEARIAEERAAAEEAVWQQILDWKIRKHEIGSQVSNDIQFMYNMRHEKRRALGSPVTDAPQKP